MIKLIDKNKYKTQMSPENADAPQDDTSLKGLTEYQTGQIEDLRKDKAAEDYDGALKSFLDIEDNTLNTIWNQSDGLAERFTNGMKALLPFYDHGGAPTKKGQLVATIRETGDKEADSMVGALKDFGDTAKIKLSKLSTKSAEKFNRISSRLRVAERVKNGLTFMNERWKTEAERFRRVDDVLRTARGKTFRGKFPGCFSKKSVYNERKTKKLLN